MIYKNSRLRLQSGDILRCGDNFLYREKVFKFIEIHQSNVRAKNITGYMRNNYLDVWHIDKIDVFYEAKKLIQPKNYALYK